MRKGGRTSERLGIHAGETARSLHDKCSSESGVTASGLACEMSNERVGIWVGGRVGECVGDWYRFGWPCEWEVDRKACALAL